MNMSRQADCPSAFVKLFTLRLAKALKALSIIGLVTVATVAGLAPGAKVALVTSAPTAAG